jgi:hypothetical protein
MRCPLNAVSRPLGAVAGAIAGLRGGRRALHPQGSTFHGVARLDAALGSLPPGEHDVIVRLSRGGGLPDRWPDVGGVAVRFPAAGGPGRPQDLLMSSSAHAPVLRHVPIPSQRLHRAWYSSLTSFEVNGRTVMFGSCFTGARELQLSVIAKGDGIWQPVGRVMLGEQADCATDGALDTDPWFDGAGIRPVGVVNELRRRAYAASRDHRPGSRTDGTVVGGSAPGRC